MNYQNRIEEMVGQHVAEFQTELSCAGAMRGLTNKPTLPYGYPPSVYHPRHFCETPVVRRFIAKTGGRLSNGVPRVLGAELLDGYPLGAYHHQDASFHH